MRRQQTERAGVRLVWLRSLISASDQRRSRSRRRPATLQQHLVAEVLEDRTLLSGVTADAFTLTNTGTAGQLSVLQQRDWDAGPAPSFRATFASGQVVQTAGIGQRFVADDYVAVDVSKTWGLSGWARSGDNFGMRFSPSNQQSFGIEEYDADYLNIESIHVLKFGASVDTTLRADLRPGDTQILLNSASGWSSSSIAGTRALAWYGYSNASGSTYANYTYTRNVATGGASGLWNVGGVSSAARTVALNAPWSGPLIAAGTAVRNATTGADHSTIALNRQTVTGDFTHTEQVAVIGGGTSVNGAYTATRFSPGTAFIRPLIVANQHGQTNNFVTWQDVRILELPAGAIVQDVRLPVVDLSLNTPGDQTVTLPLPATRNQIDPVAAEARIKIATNERYRLSVDALDMSEQDKRPVGFYSYDAEGKLIHSLHVTRFTGATDTRLARAIAPGDPAIYVTNATGWSNAIGDTSESRSIAWYGFRDGSGTLYPDYTYTRNVAFDLMNGLWDVGGIAFDNVAGAWKINLRTVWTGPAIPIGTAIRNATGHDAIQLLSIPTDRYYGSDYGYASRDNLDWFQYSATIGGGVWQNGVAAESTFRPGTVFVQPAVKAYVPDHYAVHFGVESDRGLTEQSHSAAFNGSSLATLNRSRQRVESDELVPVSPSVPVTLSAEAAFGTVLNTGQTSAEQHSIGYVPYDADGLAIESLHVTRYATAVDTTLAVTLRPGDTQITLANASGWSNIDVAGTRALAWYGYRDSSGKLYPAYSYTRNVAADVVNGLWNAGGISGNVMTLRQPWSGPTLVAGTAVRNAVSGDAMIPVALDHAALPNSWTQFAAVISGSWINGIKSFAAFPPGTSSIRMAVRANENNFAADDTIRIRNANVASSSNAPAALQAGNVTVADLDVLSNDTVAAGNIISVGTARFGTLQILTGAGIGGRDVVRYTSQAWFAGTDQFTYTVRDIATGATSTTTATVTITANNVSANPSLAAAITSQANNPASHAAPPVSKKPDLPLGYQWQLYDVEAGQTLRANDLPLTSLRQTATDADNDTLAYLLVSGVSHGVLLFRANGTFEYTPEAGFKGNDSFEYLVTDGLSTFTRRAAITVSMPAVQLLAKRMYDIVVAFHSQHDVYSRFSRPAQGAQLDANKNPYLSWRVYLLPYLGHIELFNKFHLDEPWNSANNLPLLATMPNVFRSPGDLPTETSTRFQTISDLQDLGGLSGPYKYLLRKSSYGAEFAALRDFSDGWAHTILFLQTGVDVAVPWTAPLDVDHDPTNPFAPLGALPEGRINLGMVDGSLVSLATSDIGPAGFNALVTLNSGEVIDVPTLVRRDKEQHPGSHLGGFSSNIFGFVPPQGTMGQKLSAVGLAMHNYHDVFSEFPYSRYYSYYPNGKPYHSWRVYLLPYLGYQNLFNQFHLTEPWDSPHNLTLLDQMPEVFRSDGDSASSTTTRLQVLSGPDALYVERSVSDPAFRYVGPKIRDIVDGPGNTILVAELGRDRATPWTAPDEIVFDTANPMAAFGELSGGETRVLMADGFPLEMGNDLLAANARALASRIGNETLDGYALRRMEADRSGSAIDSNREPVQTRNQLKQVGLGFHNYHDVFNRFPTEDNFHYFAPDGLPYLSWRVHLLPYFDQAALYNEFRFDEPWDSPNNIQLLDKMPQIYRSEGDAWDSATTRFQVFTGPQAPFLKAKDGQFNGFSYYRGPRISSFFDGTSYTFLAVEADESMAVPWTKPDDLEFNPNDPLGSMGLRPEDIFTVVLADGSVRTFNASEASSILSALITPAGGENISQTSGSVLPGISITGTTDSRLVISEGELGTIDVVLDKPGNVTIDVSLSAAGVVLVDKTTLTFTTANWDVPQAVTLKAIDDDLIDGAKSTVLMLSVNDAATTTDAFDTLPDIVIPVFNVNDDVPTLVTTGTSGITITEGAAGQAVSVSLSHQPASNVTVAVSALDSLQLTVSSASLLFTSGNWNTPQSVTVTAVNDVLADGNVISGILFHVTNSADPVFRNLIDATVVATVIDNEVPSLLVAISGSDTVVSEDGLTDTVSVRLGVQPVGNVVVNIVPRDPSEVSVSSSQLTFTLANWNTAQSIVISGVDDAQIDGDQLSNIDFSVAPQSSTPYLTAASATIVVKTIDDDAAQLVIVESGGSTSVSETGTTDSFTVRLSVQPVGLVNVQITSAATFEVQVQTSALTFTNSNWNTPQTVTLVGVDDQIADGNTTSTVTIAIGLGSTAPFLKAASKTVSVVNTDNEIAAMIISESSGSTVVSESGTTDTVSVKLTSAPVGNVSLLLSGSDDTEFQFSPQTLTFTSLNWNVAQTVTVTGKDDAIVDGAVDSTLTLSFAAGSGGPYSSAPSRTVSIRTLDDDPAALVISETDGTTQVSEAGTTDIVNVRLRAQPVGVVVVRVTAVDLTEVSAAPATLSFNAFNWNLNQPITVTGIDDLLIDGTQTTVLRLEVDGGLSQPEFASVQNIVNVLTLDDELAVPVLRSPLATTVNQKPPIEWYPVVDAAEYDVWIQNLATGQNPVIRRLTSWTSFTADQPMGIGDFRVWVRAIGADQRESPWSPARSFRINTPPVLQALPRYVNSLQPTVSWTAVPGAVKYDLWVNNRRTGETQVIRQSSIAGTSFTPTTPLPLGLYLAWVRAIDAAGVGASWSAGIEFYAAAASQLIGPLNPTFNRRPTFSWQPVLGAIKYDLVYRDVSTRIETRVPDLSGTSWTPPADFLNGPHEWWIRAQGLYGVVSIWSSTGRFDVGGRPVLQAIPLSSDRTPLFQWNHVDGAFRYILQVDRIDVPQSRVIRQESLLTTQFTPLTELAPGTYRAWVQAVSSSGTLSPWSLAVDFVVTQADMRPEIPDQLQASLKSSVEPLLATPPNVVTVSASSDPDDDASALDQFFFDMNPGERDSSASRYNVVSPKIRTKAIGRNRITSGESASEASRLQLNMVKDADLKTDLPE